MVIMSFCSSSVTFSFKVRYCGKREIFLRFCGITYPPKLNLNELIPCVDFKSEDRLFHIFGPIHKTDTSGQRIFICEMEDLLELLDRFSRLFLEFMTTLKT